MPMNQRLLRPLQTGFNPNSITGLQLWLDASDSSTISAGVSEWRDKSSTRSKWTQNTVSEQPQTGTQTINGRNVLVFDGTNDSLSSTTPLSTSLPLSFFMVQRIASATNFGMSYVAGAGSDDFNIRQSGTTGGLNVVASGFTVINETSGPSRAGNNDIISWLVPSGAGTSSTMFRNGTQLTLASDTLKPVLTSTHYIGRRSDGFYANIWVAEILAYSSLLSTTQRLAVQSYLAKKWGITTA